MELVVLLALTDTKMLYKDIVRQCIRDKKTEK